MFVKVLQAEAFVVGVDLVVDPRVDAVERILAFGRRRVRRSLDRKSVV